MAKKKSNARKRKRKPAWRAMIPGGKILPSMTLEELRAVKDVHALLTEKVDGPAVVGDALRSFRFLQMFGAACIVKDEYPALTCCHNELETLFGKDPAFAEGLMIPSWTLLNFPCGPGERTALDHFEDFLTAGDQIERFRFFIEAARPSRLGLYQSVLRSSDTARFRELFTERVIDAHPSLEPGAPGEIVLGRVMELDGQSYFWGDVKAFPASARDAIENMVLDKLLDAGLLDEDPAPRYEDFMRLAGPYWMSVVASDERLPILPPDHYLTYQL